MPMHWPASVLLALLLLASCTDSAPETASTEVPGIVIDYSPASTERYLGSPSIAILPNGDYVASHDIFGSGSTQDSTLVFGSTDGGQTWTPRAAMQGQWWSTLYTHRGALYLMGTSRHHGAAVIRRSTDGGRSWTTPTDSTTGLLLNDAEYHCAPVPVVEHNGRLWRAMEDAMGPNGWGEHFRSFMMSAPVDADLLRADSWTTSNRVGWDSTLLGGRFGGWLEGNAVVAPDGQIVNILRVDYRPEGGKAALITISDDGTTATFDPTTGFLDFPGGAKKFTIRYDSTSGYYWSLTNVVLDRHAGGNPERTRNTLALTRSADLRTWEVRAILLYHPDVAHHGFQYADWLVDGDDIVAVVRTAHDDGRGGAHNQHDANYMTFHRFQDFRALTTSLEP